MTGIDYNEFVKEQWMGDFDKPSLAVATLGLAGESGEVAEMVKKQLRGDPAHNPTNIADVMARDERVAKELGDILFYVTWVANYHGYTLDEVITLNVSKLTTRKERNGTLRGDGSDR